MILISVSSTKDMPQFIIDSDDRVTGDIEEFDIKLQVKPNNSYDSVALVHCGIPKSYYNVDELNSEFTIKENGNEYVGDIPSGQYTEINLPAIAKIAFDALSLAENPASPWTYSFCWDSFAFKWEITVTDHASRTRVVATSGLVFSGHTTHDILGFVDDTTNVYDISGLLISTNVANFHRTNYITIKSNICHNDGNNAPDSQILARIPVKNIAFGELIIFDLIQIEDGSKLIANNKSNQYHFGIYDDHGSLLFLNGRDWFMTLIMYEYNKLGKLQLKELDMIQKRRMFEKERRIEEIDPNSGLTIRPPPLEQTLIEDELVHEPIDLEN